MKYENNLLFRPRHNQSCSSPTNRHLKKNIIGLLDNEGETIFIP